jgi:hypothetical protein
MPVGTGTAPRLGDSLLYLLVCFSPRNPVPIALCRAVTSRALITFKPRMHTACLVTGSSIRGDFMRPRRLSRGALLCGPLIHARLPKQLANDPVPCKNGATNAFV